VLGPADEAERFREQDEIHRLQARTSLAPRDVFPTRGPPLARPPVALLTAEVVVGEQTQDALRAIVGARPRPLTLVYVLVTEI